MHTAILFSLIASIFLTIIGVVFANTFLQMMDTTPEALDKATLYLQIYFGGIVFNLTYNFGASILRAIGETKKPLYYLTFAGITNVILNLFFVIVLDMHVDGVALATIISQAISALLVIRYLMKYDGIINLNLKKLKLDIPSLKEMIYIGLPAGIQGSLFSISNVFIQKAVNSFGSTAVVAGNTASANIGGFIYSSMNAFYQACITFTSQNYGASRIRNCKKVLLYSLLCVTITGMVVGGIAVLFGKPLLSLYTNEEISISYGYDRLKVVGLTYFLCGIADVLVGSLRGLGYSIVPMITSIMGICGLRLLWIYTVFEKNHTLGVLYASYPVSWIITSLVHVICFLFIYKKIRQTFSKTIITEEMLTIN